MLTHNRIRIQWGAITVLVTLAAGCGGGGDSPTNYQYSGDGCPNSLRGPQPAICCNNPNPPPEQCAGAESASLPGMNSAMAFAAASSQSAASSIQAAENLNCQDLASRGGAVPSNCPDTQPGAIQNKALAGGLGSSKEKAKGVTTNSFSMNMPKIKSNGTAGSASGTSSESMTSLGIGTESTSPAMHNTHAATATSTDGAELKSAYAGSSGGGKRDGGITGSVGIGGEAFRLANNRSVDAADSNGTKQFGTGVNPMAPGVEDPEDYFTRLGLQDSLFKTVERRYRTKAMSWATGDLSRTGNSLK